VHLARGVEQFCTSALSPLDLQETRQQAKLGWAGRGTKLPPARGCGEPWPVGGLFFAQETPAIVVVGWACTFF